MYWFRGGQAWAWFTILLALAVAGVSWFLPFSDPVMNIRVVVGLIAVLLLTTWLTARAIDKLTRVYLELSRIMLITTTFVTAVLGITVAIGWLAGTNLAAQYYLTSMGILNALMHTWSLISLHRALPRPMRRTATTPSPTTTTTP